MKSRVAITIGDFNGIGPEVALKSLSSPVSKSIQPILIGSYDIFSWYAKQLGTKVRLTIADSVKKTERSPGIQVLNVYNGTVKQLQIGKASPDAGVCAGLAIEKAVRLCLDGDVDAMVTAPLSKESLHLAGYNFPGQTEMLAMLSRSEHVTMMLLCKTMRIGLTTIHLPIRKVAENIFPERVLEKLETINGSLRRDFCITSPRIAVLGLNPHAGENSAIGQEEREIIRPAIEKAKEKGITAEGPFPADGFFATYRPRQYDAILAMYHDQGLIPIKMAGFHDGVNFSAGLRILRTSPDHGTAFDIAGKGTAHPGSMNAAIQLARTIALNRKKKS